MMERCREVFSVRMMGRCLKVSPSGYYAWRRRPLSARAQENTRLLETIRVIHAQTDGVYGSPRMWEELRDKGEACGKHRVARLMKEAGLQGIPQRRRWRGKRSAQRPDGIENHLKRDFHRRSSMPNG